MAGGAAAAALFLLLPGCAAQPALAPQSDRLQVVTTTGLLRDLVQQVGGERVDVASIVPDGADRHTHEPSLRDARNVAYADVAFSNYSMLEERSILRTLEANLRDDARSVSLAEESIKYAAEIIPLIENINLDTIWLGLRAIGDGRSVGADRASQVIVSAVDATGPGHIFAFLTGSFGDTELYLDSSDGFDEATGYRGDTFSLPTDAHTHLSWAFTAAGHYTLTLRASLLVDDTSRPIELGESTFTFAVGVAPPDERVVLSGGHADISIDVDGGGLGILHDGVGSDHDHAHDHAHTYSPARVVIDVPPKALDEVPQGAQFAFLGQAGAPVYLLPQAVLAKHMHGEIDPHLWQNVRNTMAYVQLIRDTLTDVDPAGAAEYRANAAAYLEVLHETDEYVRSTIASIPVDHRHLVTTHHSFAYLGQAYGISIAGFVTANSAIEPSLAARRKLAETLRTLDIAAVFLEPGLAGRASTLTEVATQLGVRVCPIYGDSFDEHIVDYVSMMRFNADSLHDCLTS